MIAEIARKAVVLNAHDEHCVAMAGRVPRGCEVIYFALDRSEPVFARHLQQDGRGVYAQQGVVMLGQGEHRVPLVDVSRLPFTLHGRARHNVENALAAIAALLALDVGRDGIAAAMASFASGAHQNPLRLNVFEAAVSRCWSTTRTTPRPTARSSTPRAGSRRSG